MSPAAQQGAAGGFDRQLRRKPAGVRTHLRVAMGSAVAVGSTVIAVIIISFLVDMPDPDNAAPEDP